MLGLVIQKTMIPFLKMASLLTSIKLPSNSTQGIKQGEPSLTSMRLNNNTLPLLYLRSKTIRLFLVASNDQV